METRHTETRHMETRRMDPPHTDIPHTNICRVCVYDDIYVQTTLYIIYIFCRLSRK